MIDGSTISLAIDMVQSTVLYTDTTTRARCRFWSSRHDITARERERERGRNGATGELDRGLNALETHDHMESYQLLRRKGDLALIRSRIDETNAMSVIRDHSGYIPARSASVTGRKSGTLASTPHARESGHRMPEARHHSLSGPAIGHRTHDDLLRTSTRRSGWSMAVGNSRK